MSNFIDIRALCVARMHERHQWYASEAKEATTTSWRVEVALIVDGDVLR